MTSSESKHPVTFFLDSLASSSRRTMRHCLVSFVTWHKGSGTSIYDYPWNELTKHQFLKYRRAMIEKGVAPATINSHIAAVRGVARHCAFNIDTPASLRIDARVLSAICEVRTVPLGEIESQSLPESLINHVIQQLGSNAVGARDKALLRFLWRTGFNAKMIERIGFSVQPDNVKHLAKRFEYIYVPELRGLLYCDPNAGYACLDSMPLLELDDDTAYLLDVWSNRYLKRKFGALFVRVRSDTNIELSSPLTSASVFYIINRIKKTANEPRISLRQLSYRSQYA